MSMKPVMLLHFGSPLNRVSAFFFLLLSCLLLHFGSPLNKVTGFFPPSVMSTSSVSVMSNNLSILAQCLSCHVTQRLRLQLLPPCSHTIIKSFPVSLTKISGALSNSIFVNFLSYQSYILQSSSYCHDVTKSFTSTSPSTLRKMPGSKSSIKEH